MCARFTRDLSIKASDDALQLFDGPEVDQGVPLHPAPKYFGGDVRPTGTVLSASSGKLALSFKSNPFNTARGWSATFSADCPPLRVGRSATASSRDTMFGAKVTFTCPTGQEVGGPGTERNSELATVINRPLITGLIQFSSQMVRLRSKRNACRVAAGQCPEFRRARNATVARYRKSITALPWRPLM